MSLPLRNLILGQLRRSLGNPAAGQVTDGELLERFIAGRDEAAFELLMWRHGGMVLHVCQDLLGDAHAAEDAFQATFVALVRKASGIRARESLGGWLYQVAGRIALRLRRRAGLLAQRELPSPMVAQSALARPEADSNLTELRAQLHEEVQRLPHKYRQPIVLCCLQGLTHDEAARQLGWPKGTVAGRLARARDLLKRRLNRRGVALTGAGVTAALAVNNVAATIPPALAQATLKSAMLAAIGQTAAIAAPIFVLAQGVLRTMMWEKIKATALTMTMLALVIGVGWFAVTQSGAQPVNDGPAGAAPPGVAQEAADAGRKGKDVAAKPKQLSASHVQTQQNLKQIGLAMHNFHDTYKTFPGPAIYSEDGTPLLSWRVALLPFLDEPSIYKEFRLNEPWDSEHNRKLLAKMPAVYRSPGAKDATATHYQVFVGQNTLFDNPKGNGMQHVLDGTANTIMAIEAAAPVPWTKPEDLPYADTGKLAELGGVYPHVVYVLFADASVHAFKKRFDAAMMRNVITRNDGRATNREILIDHAPGFDDPNELAAEIERHLRATRETQDDILRLRKSLVDSLLANARQPNAGEALDLLKWESQSVSEALNRAQAEKHYLQQRIDKKESSKK